MLLESCCVGFDSLPLSLPFSDRHRTARPSHMTSVGVEPEVAAVIPIEAGKPLSDSRSHRRHLTIMRVAKFVCEGREGLGVVRNLSASGMKIDTYAAMEIGQPITVSLNDGQHLSGIIVWQQGDSIGIKFDRLASVAELLAIPVRAARGKNARPPRITADQTGLLRLVRKVPIKVDIADLSQRGAKILTDAKLTVHDNVTLELAGLKPLDATVRWARPGEAGLAFHNVLAIKAIMEWLSRPSRMK